MNKTDFGRAESSFHFLQESYIKMAKLFILLSVVAVAFAAYTPQDAYTFADGDEDGEISDDEFATYWAAVQDELEPDMRAEFSPAEGAIAKEDFETTLQELVNDWVSQGAPQPAYTVEQAANYFDADDDDEIDASEFDAWYGTAMEVVGELMETQMEGADGIITKAEFIAVLTYAASGSG